MVGMGTVNKSSKVWHVLCVVYNYTTKLFSLKVLESIYIYIYILELFQEKDVNECTMYTTTG